MNKFFKQYWWAIFVIVIPGLPILLNFLVFKPTSQSSVGRLEDWMAFWGSYLGATISALAAFIILDIQRKDAQRNYERNRVDNSMQYFRRKRITELKNPIKSDKEDKMNRQMQTNQIIYQHEVQWLSDLRKIFVKYISAYQENEIKNIINAIRGSSFESIQL